MKSDSREDSKLLQAVYTRHASVLVVCSEFMAVL